MAQGQTLYNDLNVIGALAMRDDVTWGTNSGAAIKQIILAATGPNVGVDIQTLGTGILRVPTGYEANILSEPRALTNRAYTDAHIAGKNLDATVTAPGAPQNNQAILWNQAGSKFTMGTVALGRVYRDGLTDDGTNVSLGGTVTVNVPNVINAIAGTMYFQANFGSGASPSGFKAQAVSAGVNNAGMFAGLAALDMTNTSMTVTANFSGAMKYAADYSASYTARSLTDLGYFQSHLVAKAASSLLIAPTGTEDGYIVYWNNSTGKFDLKTGTAVGSIPDQTILGNVSGVLAGPSALTGAQVNTVLPTFTSLLKGLVPASGGGTTNFLRADGNWAAPGGGTSTLTTNHIFVGNGSNVATDVAMSGDASIVASGAVTVVWANGYTTYDARYLKLAGGTLTGALILNADPVVALGAATKNYVDNLVTGLSWKQAVAVASTVNLTLSGEQTIDGFTTSGSRILVKNQSTQTQNGIYITASGSWSRALDADTGTELLGSTVFVENGTLYGDTQWANNNISITLGSTNITFVQIAGAGTYTNGTGLTLTGNVFSVTTNGITNSLIRQSAGLSVVGNSTNSTANVADIIGTTDQVLRVSTAGTALGFGTVATGGITNNAITYAKMQQASTVTLLGNPTGGTANIQEITLGAGLAFSGSTLTVGTNYGWLVGGNTLTGTATFGDISAGGFTINIQTKGITRQSIDANGNLVFTQSAQTSTWGKAILFTPGAHTGLTVATEFIDYDFAINRSKTWLDGTVTTQRDFYIRGATYNKTTTSATFTNAYTFYVDAPTAGPGVTITNNYAAGFFGGKVLMSNGNTMEFDPANNSLASNAGFSLTTQGSTRFHIGGTGSIDFTQNGQSTGWLPAIWARAGNDTIITANSERATFLFGGLIADGGFNSGGTLAASTRTVQWLAGTVATQRDFYIRGNTYTGQAATATFTDAYSFYIDGPSAGTNAAITNPWTLGLNNGGLKIIGRGSTTNYALRIFQSGGTTETSSLLDNGKTANTGIFTTTANNEIGQNYLYTITQRGTASDTVTAYNRVSIINLGSTTQNPIGMNLDVTFVQQGGVSTTVAFTSTVAGMTVTTYTNVAPASTSGSGSGALFTVVVGSATSITSVTQTTAGSGYKVNETITFNGSQFGSGSGSAVYSIVTVTGVSLGTTATAMRMNIAGWSSNAASPPKFIEFYYEGVTVGTFRTTGAGLRLYDSGGGETWRTTSGVFFVTAATTINSTFTVQSTSTFNNTVTLGVGAGVVSNYISPVNGVTTSSAFNYTGTSGGIFTANSFQSKYRVAGTIGAGLSGVGIISGISLTSGGTGYSTGNKATTGGTGTAFIVNVATVSSGVVTSVNFPASLGGAANGSGYTIGDVLTISTGGANATITVTAIDYAGTIISFDDVSNIVDAKSNNTYISLYARPTYNITSTQAGAVYGLRYAGTHTNLGSFTQYNFVYENSGSRGGIGSTSPNATWYIKGAGSIPTLSTVGAGTTTNYSIRSFQSDGTTEIFSLKDNGLASFSLNKVTFYSSTTTAAFNIPGFTTDPSVPVEGDVAYNLTAHVLKFYNGSAWITASSGGAGISNSASANELMMSDGTNAVHSLLFISGSNADLALGLAGTTGGSARDISVVGAGTNLDLSLSPKGSGNLLFGTDSGTLRTFKASGSATNISFQIWAKGNGALSLLSGSGTGGITIDDVGGIALGNFVNVALRPAPNNGGGGGTGYDLSVAGGASITAGTHNGGNLYFIGGAGTGGGTRGNVGFFTAAGSFGSGVDMIFIANATTNPSSNPTGGSLLYADSSTSHLTTRSADGKIVDLAVVTSFQQSMAISSLRI